MIRHGQTEYNRKGIIQGSGVDSSLNDKGFRQAEAFYSAYSHITFDKVYTSALQRSIQSVSGFIDKHSHEIIPEFNEISWGPYDGKLNNAELVSPYWDTVKNWKNGNVDHKVDGGESALDVSKRLKIGLERVMQNENEERILICMHGRAMRILLCLMSSTDLHLMDDFKHHNLGLYRVRFENDEYHLDVKNDVDHLGTDGLLDENWQ